MSTEEKQLVERFNDVDTTLQKDLDNRSRFAKGERFLLGAVATMAVAFVFLKAPLFIGGLVLSGISYGVCKIMKGWNDDRIDRAYQEQARIVMRIEEMKGLENAGPSLKSTSEKIADFSTAARLKRLEETVGKLEGKGKEPKLKIEKPKVLR